MRIALAAAGICLLALTGCGGTDSDSLSNATVESLSLMKLRHRGHASACRSADSRRSSSRRTADRSSSTRRAVPQSLLIGFS